MKTIHLFRHTANEGDVLTPEGIAMAVEIGQRLQGPYALAVSSGAQRATQTIGCLIAGGGQRIEGGVVVVEALRSTVEDRWRAAYQAAGSGDLASLREADEELIAADSMALADGLRAVLAMLGEGERALVVGHSPTNEAAVFGLTGVIVQPMGKGGSISVVRAGDSVLIDDR